MFIGSEKKPRLQRPPSLPTPLSLTPPNGTLKSRCSQVLTQTMPVSIFSATLCPFQVASPNASRQTIAGVICNRNRFFFTLKSMYGYNRSKISSVVHRASVATPEMTVGASQLPCSNSFGRQGYPPVSISPPPP